MKFKNDMYYKLISIHGEYLIYLSDEKWKVKFTRLDSFNGWRKTNNKTRYLPVNDLQNIIDIFEYKVEELTEGDMLLEML